MRHQKSGRHLNRTSAHRKAMLSNMSASLIEHETIKTTVVKAKELRRYVEPLITLSKTDTVANRRRAFAKLRNKAAVGKLFSELGPRYLDRPGGYTRILKAGFRRGDAAMVAYMQLLDQSDGETESTPEPLFVPEAEATEESVVEEEALAAESETTDAAVEEEADEATAAVEEPAVEEDATTEEVEATATDESADAQAGDAETDVAEADSKPDKPTT